MKKLVYWIYTKVIRPIPPMFIAAGILPPFLTMIFFISFQFNRVGDVSSFQNLESAIGHKIPDKYDSFPHVGNLHWNALGPFKKNYEITGTISNIEDYIEWRYDYKRSSKEFTDTFKMFQNMFEHEHQNETPPPIAKSGEKFVQDILGHKEPRIHTFIDILENNKFYMKICYLR